MPRGYALEQRVAHSRYIHLRHNPQIFLREGYIPALAPPRRHSILINVQCSRRRQNCALLREKIADCKKKKTSTYLPKI